MYHLQHSFLHWSYHQQYKQGEIYEIPRGLTCGHCKQTCRWVLWGYGQEKRWGGDEQSPLCGGGSRGQPGSLQWSHTELSHRRIHQPEKHTQYYRTYTDIQTPKLFLPFSLLFSENSLFYCKLVLRLIYQIFTQLPDRPCLKFKSITTTKFHNFSEILWSVETFFLYHYSFICCVILALCFYLFHQILVYFAYQLNYH